MSKPRFTFQIHALDPEALRDDLAAALAIHTERESRKRLPGLWNAIDRMNGNDSRKSSMPDAKMKRKRTAVRIWSVLCLIMGVFLFVPGVMKPSELTPALVTGAVAILFGFWGLFARSKAREPSASPSRRIVKSAEMLLSKRVEEPESPVRVSFSNEGLLMQETDGETGLYRDCQSVLYEEITHIIESGKLYLVVYGDQATVLAKSELIKGTPGELSEFLSEKVTLLH